MYVFDEGLTLRHDVKLLHNAAPLTLVSGSKCLKKTQLQGKFLRDGDSDHTLRRPAGSDSPLGLHASSSTATAAAMATVIKKKQPGSADGQTGRNLTLNFIRTCGVAATRSCNF